MCQPVVYENAARQREHLRFVLQPAEWGREYQPVVVTFEFGAVVVTKAVPLLLPEPFVRYQLFPVHHATKVLIILKKALSSQFFLLILRHYTIDMVEIKIINKGHQPLPAYATEQSAGMDLRANISEPVVLRPLERRLIPTGLFMALPQGYEAQIRPRSGLAFKKGITVLNSPGTIDSDYRGEIMVLLINFSNEDFIVNDGERIAQMVIARHEVAELVAVEVLDDTVRGEGGYGHTGVK